MEKYDFKEEQKTKMVEWRQSNISTKDKGFQNKRDYDHIVPVQYWAETLWEGIKDELIKYIESEKIQPHTGKHNLLSSWVCCANLYFPIRNNNMLRQLMNDFLKIHVSSKIVNITNVELEFAFPKGDKLNPENLLGEKDGNRGSGQTSPDVVFKVVTEKGKGYILTECKYTEHSFYTCSARKQSDIIKRMKNPDPSRCMCSANSRDYNSICHQNEWERKYWNHITLSEKGKNILKRCPASTNGYQLFRQQALAEGIAKSNKYELVASAVAYDGRNKVLTKCLSTTGVNDFTTSWSELFDGKSIFKTWTHQEWVSYVRENQKNGEFDNWLTYLKDRYGY